MPVRKVQASQASWRGVREVRRGGHPGEGAPGAYGAYRSRQPGGPYLVPQVPALADRFAVGYDPEGYRAHPLLRVLRGGGLRSGADPGTRTDAYG